MDSQGAREDVVPTWKSVAHLLEFGGQQAVRAFISDLPAGEVPRLLARLTSDERAQLLALLEPEAAASLLEQVPDSQGADILATLAPPTAAEIVHTLPSNAQADVVGELRPDEAAAVLDVMNPEEAAEVERLVRYADDTAGGVMITEYLSCSDEATVGDVLSDLRRNRDEYQNHDVQYVYVVSADNRLVGLLRLRDLVLASTHELAAAIMLTDTHSVTHDAPLEELQDFFATHPYRGVPVLDDRGALVGVVRHADVAEALEEQVASDHLKAQGIVGGEELRTMPVFTRAWHRLSWLSINIVLNILAASVIALYQDTLSAVIVLAVFLPIISDMSGCSGNQAVAVSLRELALGVICPADAWRVWRQEISVGLINALVLGALLGLAAFAWKGSAVLGLIVGAALAINTLVAVSLGGLVPLLLRRLRKDPALASGPILTTVTDMCGFLLVLSFASATLPSIA